MWNMCFKIYLWRPTIQNLWKFIKYCFLKQSAKNLIKSSVILRNGKPHIVCNLINDVFVYNHTDWFDGEKRTYCIMSAVKYFKQFVKYTKTNFRIFVDIWFSFLAKINLNLS